MNKSQKDRIVPHPTGYSADVKVGNRTLNLVVQKVHVAGGDGYTEIEVLIVQGTDGAPITVMPRAANVVWVQ